MLVSVWSEMTADPDFSAAAALLAEPARAAMLARLLDGRSWTATELARAAGVAPSTASQHLARLMAPGWIQVHAQGRFRYYRLAGEGIASFLEGFSAIAPAPPARTPGERRAAGTLRHCRLCYDHLAGRVGVALTGHLLDRGWISPEFRLTPEGTRGLAALGLRVPESPGRGCMDWSERRLHLAGPAGHHLAAALLEARWLQRDPHSRALWVTPAWTPALPVVPLPPC
jgi:DNA-binding transcriptional ArsR family regulator